MYLVYIDESGDPGLPKANASTRNAYTIAVVIIKDTDWLTTLDEIKKFRKYLYNSFNISQSAELKASYLIHGNGTLRKYKLSQEARLNIYRMMLKLEQKVGTIQTWAIVYDKNLWENKYPHKSVFDVAWQNTIERLERFTINENDTCIMFPDEGNDKRIRYLLRKMRRFSRPNVKYPVKTPLKRNATKIIEDPNFRRSEDSYFIQLADINAYAAMHHIFPKKWFGKNNWDYLGDCRYKDVNKLTGGPEGIAVKP